MGIIKGAGDMASNFAKGVAGSIAKTKVGEKGLGFYNDVLKMNDDEIAKSLARKAAAKPNSDVGKMFKDLKDANINVDPSKLNTDDVNDIKAAFLSKENARLDSNIKSSMKKEAIEKAKAKNEAKADRAWKTAGMGDYFGNAEDGINAGRVLGVGAIAGGAYATGSVVNRIVSPTATLTRDEYGNKDIVGIPFI